MPLRACCLYCKGVCSDALDRPAHWTSADTRQRLLCKSKEPLSASPMLPNSSSLLPPCACNVLYDRANKWRGCCLVLDSASLIGPEWRVNPLTKQRNATSYFLRQSLWWACLMAVLVYGMSFAGCEVAPFDPTGYKCENDLSCLPEFSCEPSTKICVLTSQVESTNSDAGSSDGGVDSGVTDTTQQDISTGTEPTPEPSPEPASEPMPEPGPEPTSE